MGTTIHLLEDISFEVRSLPPTSNIFLVGGKVLEKAVELLRVSGDARTCGALTWVSDTLYPIAMQGIFVWGQENDQLQKIENYKMYSLEKAERLWLDSLIRVSKTSYESRDPDARLSFQKEGDLPGGRWGGSIVFYPGNQKNILSFSGLPELWDEAAMFVLAIKLGQLSEVDVLRDISAERNPHLRPLLVACDWTD